ncbi:MAG TPA: septal ring lytic transglycosylase RlpA family protein [Solirubrobacterales bacterium]|nr:septal ring lytic transglycosylase RlpA family protein [Solirubrobacterales bacterium]
MTSKRTIRAIAGLACTAALLVAGPASAQTGGVPGGTGGTPTEPTAQPSSAPGSWTVHKAATWYGPGFWGRSTACGTILTPTTLGVAHRKLPCGTQVTFTYGVASVTATVIDRGPFHKGYAWDLTKKVAKRLGFLALGSGPIQATVSPPPTTP